MTKTFFNLQKIKRIASPRLALEPRVVFDAAFVATGMEILDHHVYTPLSEVATPASAVSPPALESPAPAVEKNPDALILQAAQGLKDGVTNILTPADITRAESLKPDSSSLFKTDTSSANPVLSSAVLAQAESLINDFFKSENFAAELFSLFNGGKTKPSQEWLVAVDSLQQSILQGHYSVPLNYLKDSVMHSALGAFSALGLDGRPVIYINQDWLQSGADSQAQTRVLLEEFGHSLDARLNGKTDTPGDEGQLFAAMLLHEDSSLLGFAKDDDHARLQIDGVAVDVEMASFNFVNAYRINVATTPAAKEANKHDFFVSDLGVASINDDGGSILFSGNDVSAVGINIGGSIYFGWISRPIKVGGVVKGFYFWTDVNFVDLATARADGNTDADGNSADNLGFILVVDQAYFNSVPVNDPQALPLIKTVGSSSDRVDTALNSLYVANSPPLASNDTASVLEGGVVTGNLLANDTDANGNVLNLTQFVVPNTTYSLATLTSQTLVLAQGGLSIGSLSIDRLANYSFTPTDNYTGAVPQLVYTVSDGLSTASASLSISITPVNDAPSGADKTISFNENSFYTFSAADFGLTDVLDNPVNTLVAVKITSLPTNGSLSLNGTPVVGYQFVALNLLSQLRFTAAPNANGMAYASFNFQVQDSGGTANGGVNLDPTANTITFNVLSVNSAPIAIADTITALESGGLANATPGLNPSGNLLSNDTDPDTGDSKTVVSASSAVTSNTPVTSNTFITGLFGTLSISGDGTFTYSVNNSNASVQALRLPANSLTDSFNYSMKDTAGLTSSSRLTVTINGANDNPQAVNDFNIVVGTASALPSNPVSGNLLSNDTDVDGNGETKTIDGTTATATGRVLVNQISVGAVTDYDTPKNQIKAGDIVFIYTGLTIPVNAETALQATGVTVLSGLGTQNSAGGFLQLSGLVNLSAGQTLVFKSPSGGSVSQSSAAITSLTTLASNTFFYTPDSGTVTQGMSVSGTDSAGLAFSRTVTAVDLAAGSVTVNGAALVLSSASPGLNFSLSLSGPVVLSGQYGLLSLDTSTGAYTYTPSSGLAAGVYSDKFNYSIHDAALASSSATLTIAVQVLAGTPPDAKPDTTEATESGFAPGIDPSGNVITASRTIGSVTSTESAGVDTGSTALTVQSAWSASTAVETSVATSTVIAGEYGTLTISSTGAYSYALNNSNPSVYALRLSTDNLSDRFFYRLSNSGGTDVTTLTVTIIGANDGPIAVVDTAAATEEGGIGNAVPGFNPSGNVLSNDTDVDVGDIKIVTQLAGGAVGYSKSGNYGSLILAADGSYSYTVDNLNAAVQALSVGQTLVDSFSYTVIDAAGVPATATLTITINGANDGPVNTLPNTSPSIAENASVLIPGISVADVDGNVLSVQLSVNNGSLSIADLSGAAITAGANGAASVTLSGSKIDINAALATLSYQGNLYFSGIDTLSVVSTDAGLLQDTDTLDIVVTADARPLSVNNITVNEASAYAVFTVAGAIGQRVNLTLSAGTATAGLDFAPSLEYFDTVSSSWLAYDGNPLVMTGPTLLARNAVFNDQRYEGAELFFLIATNAARISTSGTATLVDDGTGTQYPGTLTGANLDTSSVNLDDDKPLTVSSVEVNEKSPYAIFTVTGISGSTGQRVSLALINGSASDSDHGLGIEYLVGSTWTAYNSATPVAMSGNTLLVRTSISDDSFYEGRETFFIRATNAGGVSVLGQAGILDDGAGSVFLSGNTSGVADVSGTPGFPASLDDDRNFSVSSPLVNEDSSYVIFTVTGDPGLSLTLALVSEWVDASSLGKANINQAQTLQYWDGLLWADYNNVFLPAISASGILLVRVNIQAEQDSLYEGAETFKLSVNLAPANGHAALIASATILDDGNGLLYTDAVSNAGLPITTNTQGTLDNDNPSGQDKTVTINEDSVYTFAALDFSYADGAGDSDPLAAIKINTLPGAGELLFNGAPITAGFAVTASDLALNKLTYLPAQNGNGASYASFSFKVVDSTGAVGTSANTITVAVLPINDAPVANADAGAVAEDALLSVDAVSGVIQGGLGADSDVDNNRTSLQVSGAVAGTGPVTQGQGVASSLVGRLGTLTLYADGSYSYLANNANALALNEIGTDTFTYTIKDPGALVSNLARLVITVTGTNDAATVSSADVTLIETNAALSRSGVLTSTDLDNPNNSFNASSITGTIGNFAIDAAGAWTFTANSTFDGLNVGNSVDETFSVTSVDGTASQVKITITGTNDIALVSSADVTLSETNAALTSSGVLTSTDLDNPNNSFNVSSITGTISNFAIDAAGAWTFTANSAFDYLNLGDSVDETYSVTSVDGTASQVKITITGTNDAATVSSADVTLSETNAALTSSGVLTSTDLDNLNNSFNVSSITGTIGNFAIDAAGAWTFTANSAFDDLNLGGSVTETYLVTSVDGTASQVTITITGTNDVALVSSADVTLSETNAALTSSGVLTSTDLDNPNNSFNVSSTTGTIGNFAIDAAGAWTFTSNSAFDGLNQGDSVTETYSVTSVDGTTSQVKITITGTNDSAIVSSADVPLTETNTPLVSSGVLTSTDLDNPNNSFNVSSTTGTIGNFAIDAAGAWTFTSNRAFDGLNQGDSVTETYSVTSVDGTTSQVKITITGTNDSAIVSSADVPLTETNTPLVSSGVLTSTDLDNLNNSFNVSSITGTIGNFAIDAAGAWTFTANNAFDYLNLGDSVTETYSVTSVDGTASQVKITITGTNDVALVSSADVTLSETNAALTSSGVLTSTDLDNLNNSFNVSSITGTIGNFAIDAAGAWTFTANSAFDGLNLGDSVDETFSVASVDGTLSLVKISINGTNDAALITGTSSATLIKSSLPQSTGGSLLVSDVDSAEAFIAQSNVAGANGYGQFSINPAGVWTYRVNTAIDGLAAGAVLRDSLVVVTADGSRQLLTVSILGSSPAAPSAVVLASEPVYLTNQSALAPATLPVLDVALHVLSSVNDAAAVSGLRSGMGLFQTDSVSLTELSAAHNFQQLGALSFSNQQVQDANALHVQHAVRHEVFDFDTAVFVQTSVRAAQTESLARSIAVASFNSATPAVLSLLDPFAAGAQMTQFAAPSNQADQAQPRPRPPAEPTSPSVLALENPAAAQGASNPSPALDAAQAAFKTSAQASAHAGADFSANASTDFSLKAGTKAGTNAGTKASTEINELAAAAPKQRAATGFASQLQRSAEKWLTSRL